MKIDVKSLKFKNWLYLMGFSLIILIILWAFQFLFLDKFYISMKIKEVEKVGQNVSAEYNESGFAGTMRDYAFKNNLRIMHLDESGTFSGGADGFGLQIRPMGGMPELFENEFQNAIEKYQASGKDEVCFISANNRRDMSQIIYLTKVNTSGYLFISSSVPPIDSTVSVLKTQFVIITFIIFLLSLVIANHIAKNMSRPIINITNSAKKLAKGDLSVDFEGEGYTEIYQLAETLNYATNELSKLDKYRKEFIANVSHDLKTPLTIIKMYGEMIRDITGEDPEKRDANSKKIIMEADRLSDMVNEILELSKLESGNAQMSKHPVNISECLKETLSSFNVLSKREGYIFYSDIHEDLIINANAPYIRRIFYNMISNAVNYTGEDKTVYISLKRYANKIRFEVRDTGAGISSEKLDSIWERYYKSDMPHKRAVIGTGLGLAIAKQLLELHGAVFGVSSLQNEGSIFWFEL